MLETETEDKEIHRDHFEECLKHFNSRLYSHFPKGSSEIVDAKRVIVDFCGVSLGSVTEWTSGRQAPVGEKLIMLMCFLDLQGYKVIQLERMTKAKRNFVELIGYRVISSKKAAELTGFKSTSTLYSVLMDRYNAGPKKNQKMFDIWKVKKEELEKKKETAKKSHCLNFEKTVEVKKEKKVPIAKALAHRSLTKAIISIIESLLYLLEEDEKFSEKELGELREKSSIIFSLLSRLNALTAKLVMPDQQKGG